MSGTVTLTITHGKLAGQVFRFDERAACIVGRSKECHLQLPNDDAHRKISRHHCLIDINPPDVRIRDFGSLNGTFVNGKKIGQRKRGQSPQEAREISFPEHDLSDGDTIQLGDTIFQVGVTMQALCVDCSAEIPDDQREESRISDDLYRCQTCRHKSPASVIPKQQTCALCGKDVSQEVARKQQGDYICLSCRKDPMKVIYFLMKAADQGKQELLAIQGYKIHKMLGHGGMGAVYLARHERSGQEVALKVMLPEVAADEKAEQQFLRETAMTKALTHPHVVQLYDHGCSKGTFFFTLEFCDAGSVDRLILQRGGKLPIDEALELIFQLLDGLEYAHTIKIPDVKLADGSTQTVHGLVHRDLKPGNFFLSGSGSQRLAKIADYGFAKAFDTAGLSGLTMTGAVAGTPAFMPRQQVINFKYAKPEVDVWAMAASLYNMLTSQIPRNFQKGKDPWMLLLRESSIPIRERDPSIPSKLANVIDEALIDKPAITFKTAADFKRALEGAL